MYRVAPVTIAMLAAGSLAGCAAAAPTPVSGVIAKTTSYSTYTRIGAALDRGDFGSFEQSKIQYCEQIVEGFSLGGRDVTIKDAEGTLVGVAPLEFDEAATVKPLSGSLTCLWSFTLEDLKSESDFFVVELEGVSGDQNVTRDELLAGLTLSVPAS